MRRAYEFNDKKTIDSYELDHKYPALFLYTFLHKVINKYKYIETGYIGIISHDMWLVRSHNNINFSELLKAKESKSPLTVQNQIFGHIILCIPHRINMLVALVGGVFDNSSSY